MGHHVVAVRDTGSHSRRPPPLTHCYSCEGPVRWSALLSASAGKQLGPTADRHVSGGFRLSGQRSRVAWLGVGVGSDGDHWAGFGNVSPDGTWTTGPLPRGRIDRIKLISKLSTPAGTTGEGGGCSINRLIGLRFYWLGLDPCLLRGAFGEAVRRSVPLSASYALFL